MSNRKRFRSGVYEERKERAKMCAWYIICNEATVRKTAEYFAMSKSTVHKDVAQRLLGIAPILARRVREVLDKNKAERHIRGGKATKMKYRKKLL